MRINDKEHYDLMNQFEREFKYLRLEREDKDMWSHGAIYKDGYVNSLFLAYRSGYAFGKIVNNV